MLGELCYPDISPQSWSWPWIFKIKFKKIVVSHEYVVRLMWNKKEANRMDAGLIMWHWPLTTCMPLTLDFHALYTSQWLALLGWHWKCSWFSHGMLIVINQCVGLGLETCQTNTEVFSYFMRTKRGELADSDPSFAGHWPETGTSWEDSLKP